MRSGGIERGVELVLLTDVGGEPGGVLADGRDRLVEQLPAPRDKRDPRPTARQQPGGDQADAARPAGDDDVPAVEFQEPLLLPHSSPRT